MVGHRVGHWADECGMDVDSGKVLRDLFWRLPTRSRRRALRGAVVQRGGNLQPLEADRSKCAPFSVRRLTVVLCLFF